jgi:hypothetical protein
MEWHFSDLERDMLVAHFYLQLLSPILVLLGPFGIVFSVSV